MMSRDSDIFIDLAKEAAIRDLEKAKFWKFIKALEVRTGKPVIPNLSVLDAFRRPTTWLLSQYSESSQKRVILLAKLDIIGFQTYSPEYAIEIESILNMKRPAWGAISALTYGAIEGMLEIFGQSRGIKRQKGKVDVLISVLKQEYPELGKKILKLWKPGKGAGRNSIIHGHIEKWPDSDHAWALIDAAITLSEILNEN